MKLTEEVKEALSSATVKDNTLTLSGQLDRKSYVAVAKAIEMLGGKWNKKAKCHLFEDDAADVVADAIATGAIVDWRKEFQFYETPEPVVATMMAALHLSFDKTPGGPQPTVLEPSAGKGAIVKGLLETYKVTPTVCELNTLFHAELKGLGCSVVAEDFLAYPPIAAYNVIAMNPPFRLGRDMLHVTHAYECLAPGGRLVSVMSPGWEFKQSKQATKFRTLVNVSGGAWYPLPEGSFKVSGTNVNTGILVLDK